MFRLYRPITPKDLEEIVVDAICDGVEQDFSKKEPEDESNKSLGEVRSGQVELSCQ